MKSKAYRAVEVHRVVIERCLEGRASAPVHVGFDIGKESIYCVLRWGIGDFDRVWKVRNTADITRVGELLRVVGGGRTMIAAMEPTGTYGDALRQALERAGVTVHRVSPKQASDDAEVFDGVPSQHDGKDAAVVAELAAQGKCWPWPIPKPNEVEQELAYLVDWLDGQRRQMMQWCGRLEAQMSRHWPEATQILALTSATLLHCLAKYGGPRGLAADPKGVERVQTWGRHFLTAEKAEALVASARETLGMAMGPWDEVRMQRCVEQIQACRREMSVAKRRMTELALGHPAIGAMGKVVGLPTACVLWVELGDPSQYHCGPAYRKAMGLNLAERSSGKWLGKLRITKRGSSKVRRWLYLAALRWVREEPVQSGYQRQVAARRGERKSAVVAVMRKLALALYRVGGRGEAFDRAKIYRSQTEPASK